MHASRRRLRAIAPPNPCFPGSNSPGQAGLSLALATMRVGEVARLEVAPEYGYGEEGSFSFPTVPPLARLEYEVELLDFDDIDDDTVCWLEWVPGGRCGGWGPGGVCGRDTPRPGSKPF